jgi:hypothetical protein
MDPGGWGQYGLVGLFCGAMLAAQLWFMRQLVTVTFPSMLANFAAELKMERELRVANHLDNRADHHRLYERIERAEGVFATALQATRHRIINVETGLTGVLEALKNLKEWLQHQPGAVRRPRQQPERREGDES